MANITIVRKGDSFSNHSSFKTACIAYGWSYDDLRRQHGGVPSSVGDYLIERHEKEMTIECQKLKQYLSSDFDQSHDWDDEGDDGDSKKIIWEFGKARDYIVEGWVSIRSERNEVATDALGYDLEYIETTADINEIVSVVDSDGIEVNMTAEVENLLIEKLSL